MVFNSLNLLPLSLQKLLVLILPTSEGWKAKSTLEPPSGFEHEIPGLEIQYLNHKDIAPCKFWFSNICANNDFIGAVNLHAYLP